MWKLLFLARRGWKMIPKEQRRRALGAARRHGPKAARAAGRAVRQARTRAR